MKESPKRNCPNESGGLFIFRGVFPLQSLLYWVLLTTGPLVQWSLFMGPDWTEGTEGHQGLPGASSPSQLSHGCLQLGTGLRPEPEAILSSSLSSPCPVAIVCLPVTPPSILCESVHSVVYFSAASSSTKHSTGPCGAQASLGGTAPPSWWL